MTYFLTFGDDKYTNSKKRIYHEAINSNLFDYIAIYGPNDLSKEFIEKTSPYIHENRGCGFWLWKSFLLKKTFDNMNEGDFCVYADAGCTINPYGGERFEYYKSLIKETGVLSFRMDGLNEEAYTTEEIFKEFNITDDSIRKSGQIMATILIFMKNEKSVKLIDDFYNLALSKAKLFSDENNFAGNCSRFIDARHDQSCFSVMRKVYGSTEIIDETYADSMEGWNKKIYETKMPFLATRIRN
jgi:hypothetical protein